MSFADLARPRFRHFGVAPHELRAPRPLHAPTAAKAKAHPSLRRLSEGHHRSPLKGHSEHVIHARHLARLKHEALWREYRLEVREWRRALRERERLLIELLRLEHRL